MLTRLRSRRPSHTTVVAYLALFVAVGDTTYAAATIGPNAIKNDAIRSRHILNGAVGSADLANNSVGPAKVIDGSLKPQDLSAAALQGPGLLGRGEPVDFRLAPALPVTTTVVLQSNLPAGRTFLLSDVIVQNPASDIGRLRIQRGESTLVELGLQNFRADQHHFDTPVRFLPGQKVTVFIDCDNPSSGCTPSALFVGVLAN